MQVGGVAGERDARRPFQGRLALQDGKHALTVRGLAVHDRLGAERLDQNDGRLQRLGLARLRKMQVLRADADGHVQPETGRLVRDVHQVGRQEVHVRRADEARDEAVRGPVEELERGRHLLDPTVAQDDDAVGQRHRLDLVVGDVDHRRAEAVVQAGEFGPHRHAQFGVEVRQRLVEQEGRGLAHDGAADGDALALAAGELAGPAVEQLAISSIRAAPSIRSRISALDMRVFSSPKAMFCRTLMCG